ncbi:sigma-54-dependent Fis family transcriptional regulator [Geothrix edaphica]|uniref:Sigma-54-dependent Fis family transcriptional regulator n=1 Tax=Geothrix edaphica TaxID=2927976 RepID=A0ABQ5PY23_9BACT|nr:sigma-54-dependent Fis family transcriptional regulator [Geothrix edaphica]GLH67004.1 sigma-54-dependent Fis family transcriptional regulator [Geothrix edaphica]
MRAGDLDHKELLELDPEGGLIRFAGQRAILLDAVAMGLLRKYLVENFGFTAARTVLTQFGFAHGWRMAEAMRTEFKWDDEAEWRRAGNRIHTLGGLFSVQTEDKDPLSKEGMMLVTSYEAEQHLLHFGRADAPMCWTICGLISGYLSRIAGQEIFVLEDRCQGKGDAGCHLFGRTREEWGDTRAEELWFYDKSRLSDALDVSIHRVTETLKAAERKLKEHRKAMVSTIRESGEPMYGIVARSAAMRQVVDLACRVAKVDSTVLITGESGSGKERIARLVHDESTRMSGPFIAVNCGAIAETLLESELFGHARGAFTGATHDRPGLFESANGGTLLLDEVGEVSPGMQVKLLRALQEREIRRVGENKNRKVNVRIIAATNRDLALGVTDGNFRQDLYYRLKVVELHVPPLRERRDDILPLARVLLAGSALSMKRKITGLTPGAADQLLRYPWPGNVRELENVMERAVALSPGNRVELEDLPEEVRQACALPPTADGTVRPLEVIEKEYILAALALNGGNQTRTSEQLHIGSATLYRKLKSYGLIGGERANNQSL